VSESDFTHTGRILVVENDRKHNLRDFVRFGDKLSPEGKWPDEGYIAFYIIENGHKDEQKHMAT
jgi:hypothetical protein